MKRFLLIITIAFSTVCFANAQRIGYLNSENILNQIPEYVIATQNLDELADSYKSLIEVELGKVDKLYRNYQNNKSYYTASQKQSKENQIIEAERAVKEMQDEYFGEGGVMAQKSEQLLGPIRERVQAAIDIVSKQRGYQLVIDLAVVTGVVYLDGSQSLDNEVIKILKQ